MGFHADGHIVLCCTAAGAFCTRDYVVAVASCVSTSTTSGTYVGLGARDSIALPGPLSNSVAMGQPIV